MLLATLIVAAVALGGLSWLAWGMGYGRDRDDDDSGYTEPDGPPGSDAGP